MVSAVSPRGELHFQVHETGIKQEEFLEFCKMLMADAGRPVFLIMDNSQVHRAKILKAYAEESNGMLTLFFLPPYSPDLNPDEWGVEERQARQPRPGLGKERGRACRVRQRRTRQAEDTAR